MKMKTFLPIAREKVRAVTILSSFPLLLFTEAEAVEKRRKEKEEHSVEAFESKFKQIQEISGEPDLERLVDKFIEGLIVFYSMQSRENIESLFSGR